jgi:hypothetical protein
MGDEAVRDVAARWLPVQDAAWGHITHCSPCFREFLGIRRELTDARKRLVRRNRIVLVSALAAAGIAAWRSGRAGSTAHGGRRQSRRLSELTSGLSR